ncbi:hypothetical protein D9756_006007 [Leucocoprinus leucothites]|uniref:Uncharacterized protein n=1 Tax=Leucocoprinus leucothites TaxID=201217 RepID=A0A8H5FXU0_9AGAR|nr:hypothetical protein D9756_006007 [Leucoagaricus leucothites]
MSGILLPNPSPCSCARMKFTSFATLVAFTAFTTVSAQATTSIIVPGFDAQPLSADVIGVDTSAGQTTWAVQAGPGGDMPGTATLVEGSDYASIHYIGLSPETTFTMDYGCTYQGGQAICSGTRDGQAATETGSADTPIAVVVGSTAAPNAPTPVAATPNTGGSGPVSATGSSSGTSSASSPSQSSGANSISTVWSSVIAFCSVFTVGFVISA